MHTELAAGRYEFSCPHCGARWISDYDVQHVTSHDSGTWQYYSLNGIRVPAPAGHGCVTCRACGATHLHASLIARRDIPLPSGATTISGGGSPAPTAPAMPARRCSAGTPAPSARTAQRQPPPAQPPDIRGSPPGLTMKIWSRYPALPDLVTARSPGFARRRRACRSPGAGLGTRRPGALLDDPYSR